VTHEGSSNATPDEAPPTVLHSSLTGIALSFSSVAVLVALVVFSIGSGGAVVVTVALAVLASVGAAVILLDMPISSSFDSSGVTRRALLRHQRLHWDDIDRLSRSRKGMFRSSKMAPTGGLIAVRERRNYTLVDRMEGHVEFGRLRVSLGEAGERLGVDRIAQPPLDQPPTWLHRRAKWAPTSRTER
jgi:hypothetical protein